MIITIDKLNYNPCENQLDRQITLNDIICQIEEEKKLEQMYFFGDEDIDFIGIESSDLQFLDEEYEN